MSGSEVTAAYVHARATAWVSDEPFPGIVRVELTDGDGKVWIFEDKSAVFDEKNVLRSDTHYPLDIELACTILRREETEAGYRVVVSTSVPWGIETREGQHEFRMDPEQIRRI